ncbi:MAG: hypothetical protein JRI79_04640 [Deltaproteobacteria bacterium]|nr:hypothetical protein [Deltaproteobacteria bacterium]MBW1934409.1 hypothetical protein [Deltaproteobacteria bacterium]MBW1977247.1 hypothetical protein [Deltaproteobacteria bacterium]MBW2044990.1 hypothetical protein [Deltaproteobacteria bacterium]MBW2300998.1 hypothetical protein [Deltaproteobacteria bacterium]
MGRKQCFGILDKVFPLGERGIREVPGKCFECADRILCLKEALATREGLNFRAELLERDAGSGLVGKLRRWSQKKTLARMMDREKGKGK